MTCAICGWAVGYGVYRDARDRPVHYWCRILREAVRETAETIAAKGTPPRARRQTARRVHQ